MLYVTRRVEFCASHRLHNPDLTEDQNREIYGVCSNPGGHGHNYALEVTIQGKLDPGTGMLMDLKRLKHLLIDVIVDKVDHRNLNTDVEFMRGVIPTAENLVASFWELLRDRLPEGCVLSEIRLWESRSSMVCYRGEGAEIIRHAGHRD
jgi:6-pyruvoyltetrahydropterin/6-carboxytetrahydropterin synthase